MDSNDCRLVIDPKRVVFDLVEDEGLLIHVETGNYFSLRGCAPEIWRNVERGLALRDIIAAMAARFGKPADELLAVVAPFIARLLAEDLLATSEARGAAGVPVELTAHGFAPPILEKYSDMTDLLMLDPIHEVDPVRGWPVQRETNA